ncbi:MAG: phage shock protein PspC [Actinomycetia bacterium]|jgi:phage shock protein C|nr:phage shock protein PspC [Actinomycetes bacterium]
MNTTPGFNKRFVRTRNGRMIAGVCSGAGEYFGVDANILRLALAVFTVLGGAGVLVYALGWLLIPEEGKETSIVQELINKQQQKTP